MELSDNRRMSVQIFFSALFLSIACFATPHPGTGSSMLNQPNWSSMFSQMGFEIKNVPSDWKALPLAEIDQPQIDLGANNQYDKARLSFRSEQLKAKIHLETYVKKFLRDYNQYGYEVLGMQTYKNAAYPAIILDVVQKNKKSRSRQMFFYNKTDRVVVATCVDEFATFDKTLAKCNRILESFNWK